MNIILECEVVLSNKLRAICEEGEPISVSMEAVRAGVAKALIRMAVKDGSSLKKISQTGRTSLELNVTGAEADIQNVDASRRYGNLFGGSQTPAAQVGIVDPNVPQGDPHPLQFRQLPPGTLQGQSQTQTRLAEWYPAAQQVDPNYKQQAVPPQMPYPQPQPYPQQPYPQQPYPQQPYPQQLQQPQQPYPQQFQPQFQPQQPYPQQFQPQQPYGYPQQPMRSHVDSIMSFDEMNAELATIGDVEGSQIRVPPGAKLTREQAMQLEQSIPRLRRRCFVQNVLPSQLLIADCGIAMPPNGVQELSRIPARILKDSNDLRWCFETGKLRLIPFEAFQAVVSRTVSRSQDRKDSPLPVFDSYTEAGNAIVNDRDLVEIPGMPRQPVSVRDDAPLITEEDARAPINYEEDPSMDTLVRGMPFDKREAAAMGQTQAPVQVMSAQEALYGYRGAGPSQAGVQKRHIPRQMVAQAPQMPPMAPIRTL